MHRSLSRRPLLIRARFRTRDRLTLLPSTDRGTVCCGMLLVTGVQPRSTAWHLVLFQRAVFLTHILMSISHLEESGCSPRVSEQPASSRNFSSPLQASKLPCIFLVFLVFFWSMRNAMAQ